LDKTAHPTKPVLSLSNVSLKVDGKEVVHDVTWEIRRGENWVLVGPNGAGKTTLLRMLNGYQWPSSGRVSVLGETFGNVDLRELRMKIGLVSAYISDWIPDDDSVLDVVLSGKYASIGLWNATSPADRRLATSLLRRMGCERYSEGKFGRLSQGEKQKVVIARALMTRPHLIALDEPCAGLDIPGREKFLSTLRSMALSGSPSIVYVTHRIEEIPAGFTHAILLKKGRVISRGRIGEVLNDHGLSALFGVRIKVSKWRERYYALVDD
jgi:iron complex transport system ATP-binding protein